MNLDFLERIVKLFINKDGGINKYTAIIVSIIFVLIILYSVVIPVLHDICLPAPNQPELIYPREGQKDVEILPTFSWRGGNDESQFSLLHSQINNNLTNLHRLNPEIIYGIYVSNNKTEIKANSIGSRTGNESSLPLDYCIGQKLDANTTYYWKVVADNGNAFNESNSESPVRTFKTISKPHIDVFEINNKNDNIEIQPGDRVYLRWNVLNVEEVSLNKQRYRPNDEKWDKLVNSMDYTLTANNEAGSDSKTINVFISEPIPQFDFFIPVADNNTNTTAYITPGQNVTLSWQVSNAETLWLEQAADKPFNIRDSYQVSPIKNSTYTLFAENKNHKKESRNAYVVIIQP